MSIKTDEASYALNKQVPTMHAISTNYGEIEIDDALMDKIKPVIEEHFQALLNNS